MLLREEHWEQVEKKFKELGLSTGYIRPGHHPPERVEDLKNGYFSPKEGNRVIRNKKLSEDEFFKQRTRGTSTMAYGQGGRTR
ncbi:MAG: hypothetical protein ACOX1J_03255 [Dethiobacteria bacterium]